MPAEQEVIGGDITVIAGEDLSSKQFYFVKLSDVNTVVVPTAATDPVLGVLQNAPASGYEARVRIMGISKVSSAEAITIGAAVGTDGSGQAQVLTEGDVTEGTYYTVGRAVNTSSNANEYASILITQEGRAA